MRITIILISVMIFLNVGLAGCNSEKVRQNITETGEPSSSIMNESESPRMIQTQKPNAVPFATGPESTKADHYYIEEVVRNYEILLIEAINNNDFSLVENLLVTNSNLYNSQKKLVSDLYKKNIKEKLIDFDIKDIKETEKVGIYKVYVNERIGIKYPERQDFEIKEFNWIYTVVNNKDGIGISDMNKWSR